MMFDASFASMEGSTIFTASGKDSILSAVVPLMKLLTPTVVGLLLAHPRLQIAAPTATFKLLAKLVFALFLPCLVFVQLGQSINLGNILRWWFIPVNVLVSTAIGCALGYVVAIVCRPPPEFVRLTVIMTGFGNTGNLPIAIVSSICHSSDQTFGPGCDRTGVAYISFSQWVAVILVYTLVYRMMEPPPPSQDEAEGEHENGLLQEMEQSNNKPFIARIFLSITGTGSSRHNFPDLDFDEDRTPVCRILLPPAIASLLAVVVGLVPPLRDFMFGEGAPLAFISDSLDILAQAAVPFVMLIIGGMLAEGPGESKLGFKTIAGVTAARLVVLPVFGIGVVSAAEKVNFLPKGDEMYRFVALLQYMTPSAIVLGAIASLRGYAVGEASAILFWQHVCAVFSLSVYVGVYFKFLR